MVFRTLLPSRIEIRVNKKTSSTGSFFIVVNNLAVQFIESLQVFFELSLVLNKLEQTLLCKLGTITRPT